VGVLERGWRWCPGATRRWRVCWVWWRRPLLLGTVVSSVLAAWALGEASRADTEAANARQAQQQAEKEKTQAQEQAAIAQAVNDFVQNDLLRQADSRQQADREFEPDPNVTVRQLVQRASSGIEERFQERPLVAAALRQAIGEAFGGVGEYDKAISHLTVARQLRTAQLGLDHLDTLTTLHHLAVAYRNAGRTDEAIQLHEQVREQRTQQLGSDHPDTLTTLNSLAWVYLDAGPNRRSHQALRAATGATDPEAEPRAPGHTAHPEQARHRVLQSRQEHRGNPALRTGARAAHQEARTRTPRHLAYAGQPSPWRT